MRPIQVVVVLFAVVACSACNDPKEGNIGSIGSVVGPPPPPPPPSSPLSDVSGTWTAKISYDYADDWCTCCIPDYQATATFTQNGTDVSGSIKSQCLQEQFKGTLQGGQLSGTVNGIDINTPYTGLASGAATTTVFELATNHLQIDGHGISNYTMTFSR